MLEDRRSPVIKRSQALIQIYKIIDKPKCYGTPVQTIVMADYFKYGYSNCH